MNRLECLLIENDCWKKYSGVAFEPTGIVVHSTDPASKVISRFVQPAPNQMYGMTINGENATADEMLAVLGKNKYSNDWNRSGKEVAVHAFVGELANGSLAVCQTLDWTMPCWGAGSGKNGSYNGCYNGKPKEPLYIQFEMIEDEKTATDHTYCKNVTDLAIELCADLMKLFPTIKLENVVSHKEAHARGYATDHGDPESWWKRHSTGMDMATFRGKVQDKLNQFDPQPPIYEHHPFTDVPDGRWFSEDVQWAWENGLIDGVTPTTFKPASPLTRAQACTLMRRFAGKFCPEGVK